MESDLDRVLPFVKKRGVVIQAGGNCGVWPRRLAREFETVYTFEPHPANFAALAFNTASMLNVVRFQAALGNVPQLIKLELAPHEKNNGGAFYVQPGGYVPTLRLDDMGFESCDLLYLDIEGFELPAIMGADDLIKKTKPVIAVEDKGLSEKYGFKQGAISAWLADLGYREAVRFHRDIVFIAA